MYNTVISAQALQENYQADSWIILDCRFTLAAAGNSDDKSDEKGEALYAQGHIERASYLHLNNQLSGAITASSGRHPLPCIADLCHTFSQVGIGEGKQVVVYDDCSGGMAARAWWLLQWMGHTNVAVLDGGIQAWQGLDFPLSSQSYTAPTAHFVRHHSTFEVCSTEQICGGSYQLVDARAAPRFRGEVEPIDAIAGHVCGAINRPFTSNLSAQGLFKTSEELAVELAPLAVDSTVHMCGSGVTACHNILAMSHAGFKPSKLYVGSWSEWIRDSARSVATGLE
ncbi:MAG: sulfurtransferase [Oceanospirillaceae bacterium]|nr:sulfurtransferase [Oceanospirillaceae bacterium]